MSVNYHTFCKETTIKDTPISFNPLNSLQNQCDMLYGSNKEKLHKGRPITAKGCDSLIGNSQWIDNTKKGNFVSDYYITPKNHNHHSKHSIEYLQEDNAYVIFS